jgi:hypothetical protein
VRFYSPTAATIEGFYRTAYPFTYSVIGLGGVSCKYTLYTDSEDARKKWHLELRNGLACHAAANNAGKVLEMRSLGVETFFEGERSGRVLCSAPFSK